MVQRRNKQRAGQRKPDKVRSVPGNDGPSERRDARVEESRRDLFMG